MKKRLLALLLVMTMVIMGLVACGGSDEPEESTAPEATEAPADEGEPADDATEAPAEDDGTDDAAGEATQPEPDTGKVLRIYCWNDEIQNRVKKFYPDYNEADDTIGDVKVEWVLTPNEDNAYQTKLDKDLLNQEAASADEKIDMFLVEADYALKYVNTDYTMDIKDMGITDEDVANQYKYTQEIMTSDDGKVKGLSWQAAPGLFLYRRSIAKEVFGTEEPEEVQELLGDWDKFNAAAQKLNEDSDGKYVMLSGYDDSYRAFSNNVSAPWVEGNKIVIDPNIEKWIEQTKDFTDKGYNNKSSLWDETWSKGQGPDGNVLGYFYSSWGIAFNLLDNSLATPVDKGGKKEVGNGNYGDWAGIRGPEPYYWGGSWICGTTGSDNVNLVADIMKKLTCDKDIMKEITLQEQDFTNNKAGIQEIIDSGYSNPFLGGQDHISLLAGAADEIDMSNISPYDQACNEGIQAAMKDYFAGEVDYDKALENFYEAVTTKHPELTK